MDDVKRIKPCRTCTDFKTWSANNKNKMTRPQDSLSASKTSENVKPHLECPVDKDELGRSTWNLLHTVAAHYPDKPNDSDKIKIEKFFSTVAQMYPCEVCAEDFQKQIRRFPPKTDSQETLTQWLCRAHNRINLRIGKEQFDCRLVNERWRDGWMDGSCD